MGKNGGVRADRERLLEGIGVPEKSEFIVDEFQQEAINAVVDGQDTLVVAPTGAGKTYIAMESISATLKLGCKAIYTTPLKALSNTKYAELKKQFEPEHKIGLLTGDRKIDADADCVVATTEIYRNELYRDYGQYSVVVLDEVHFISDLQRGPVWEESIILTPRDSALLMLSASISNAEEIAAWLEEVREKPCKIVRRTHRPVELRLGFLHPEKGVLPLHDENGGILPDVAQYYRNVSLDSSGMRLRGGKFSRPKWGGKGGKPRSKGKNTRGKKRKRRD